MEVNDSTVNGEPSADKDDDIVLEDDLDAPIRKPIGWNYQNVFNGTKEEKKVNGSCHNKDMEVSLNSSSDDIEVLEILDDEQSTPVNRPLAKRNFIPRTNLKNKKSLHAKSNLNNIPSSTKKEIKAILRNVNQSSITKFFQPDSPVKSNSATSNIKEETKFSAKVISVKKEESGDKDMKCGVKGEMDEKNIENERVEAKENRLDTSEYSKSLMENFIEKWKSVKAFETDDQKVMERLWKLYNGCHKTYIHSRKFLEGLKRATMQVTDEENLFCFLKSIIKTLKKYKDIPYVEKKLEYRGESSNAEGEKKDQEEKKEELSEEEMKKRRKIKRIEKALIETSKEINKLELEEVDLDDEDNSSYLILERLKSKFVKLDEKYCKIANYSTTTGRPMEKKFRYKGSRYPEINMRITAWVNKKRCFPDYTDVLNLVKEVTKDSALPLRPEVIRVQAQEIFRDVGKILKSRREKDDFFCINAYAGLNEEGELSIDPADCNSELRVRLKENEATANKNLDNVFQHFVDEELKRKEEEKASEKKSSKEKRENGEEAEGNEKEEGKDDVEGDDDVEDDESESLLAREDDLRMESEEEIEDLDDEDDEDEDEDIECVQEGPSENPSPVFDISESEEYKFEDSDVEIQEVLNDNGLRKVGEEEEEEEEEEEYEEVIEEKEREEYALGNAADSDPVECLQVNDFSEEDIDIAFSPRGSGHGSENSEEAARNQRLSPEVTVFKRKEPFDVLGTDVIPSKKPRVVTPEPEIVELD